MTFNLPTFTPPLPITASPLHAPHACSLRARRAPSPPRLSVATPPAPPPLPSDHDDTISLIAPPILGLSSLNAALSAPPSLVASPDTLLVVIFHARWCRVCKTLLHKLPRIAPMYPHVKWLSVDFAEHENKQLCRELGVKLLPTFQFYRPGAVAGTAVLEQFTSGPFGIKRVEERLQPYGPPLRR